MLTKSKALWFRVLRSKYNVKDRLPTSINRIFVRIFGDRSLWFGPSFVKI